MIKINSKIGTFYLVEESYQWWLEDSEHSTIAEVTDEQVEQLKKLNSIEDLVEIGICENVSWAPTEEEVIEPSMEYAYNNLDEEDINDFMEHIKQKIYIIGKTYFIMDYTDIY